MALFVFALKFHLYIKGSRITWSASDSKPWYRDFDQSIMKPINYLKKKNMNNFW